MTKQAPRSRIAAMAGALAGACALAASPARADGYAECSQILAQDIFNKVIRSESSRQEASAEMRAAFYQQNEDEAYDAFSKALHEAKQNGTKIDTEFHYGIIGGELGIDLKSQREVSSQEFKEKFRKAKSTYQGSSMSKTSSSQQLASSYASYVRDPGTVSAWKDCVTRTRETNVYAFASRDEAGKTYVNVVWVPGPLAGTVPSITIGFVTDGDAEGVQVHAQPEEPLAAGSGRNFAVSCGPKCDGGFRIVVNGALKDAAGRPTSSFTSTVDVPPLKLPAAPIPGGPSLAGTWRQIIDGSSVGAGTGIEKIQFTARDATTYDVVSGRGRDATRGIATLTGNLLRANFETALTGAVGQVTWEMNATFTEGNGTAVLHSPYLDKPIELPSKLVRTQ